MTETDDKAAAESSVLPAHTTPTWEMELLVSGATTFGLLQLPSLLDRAYFIVASRAAENLANLAFPVWIYSKVSLITLIVTFIVHLCLRGYWVALVGMNSVYPGGVRWQNLRIGPISRAISERNTPPMNEAIELADNRATRVFGTGFGVAMLMLIPVMLVLIVLMCTQLVEIVLGPEAAVIAFAASIAVVVAPWMLAILADRRIGQRFAADSPIGRLIAIVLAFYSRCGVDRKNNLLIALFLSNTGGMRGRLVVVTIMIPVMAIIMIPPLVAEGKLPLGHLAGFLNTGSTAERSAPAQFYASLDSDRRNSMPQPFISDRIARDAYLPLFIPFIPSKHVPAMQIACPAVLLRQAANGSRAGLDCLAKITDVRIDSITIHARLDASTDPQTGQPGLLAMLPMATISPGRHELSLRMPAGEAKSSAAAARRVRIPFWK